VDTFERIVLVLASVVTVFGAVAVLWREFSMPDDRTLGARIRRMLEVLLPAAGLVGLLVWLWVR
jgi:hypothetical protein